MPQPNMVPSPPARLLVSSAASLALLLFPNGRASGFIPDTLPHAPTQISSSFWSRGTMTRSAVVGGLRLNAMLPREPQGERGDDDDEDEDRSEVDDVEAARIRLEALFGDGSSGREGREGTVSGRGRGSSQRRSSTPSSASGSLLPPEWEDQLDSPLSSSSHSHPLTSIGRERRLAEIALLQSLENSDDALSDLWALWFSERGPDAAADLLRAEELAGRKVKKGTTEEGGGSSSTRKFHDEAEQRMRDMIDRHGVHWSEPVNRLATLLYRRGRLEEARALCQLVLAVKPWHFGALSGIVLVCAGMGDKAGARLWADRRLPPLQPVGDNPRRVQWVRRAVEEATRSLGRAEELVLESFGERDDYTCYEGSGSSSVERKSKSGGTVEPYDSGDTDAWQ